MGFVKSECPAAVSKAPPKLTWLSSDFHQLLALRLLLGLLECPLFPGLSLMMVSWYPRREVGLRQSLFFSGAVLAGAFGGILGYARQSLASRVCVCSRG